MAQPPGGSFQAWLAKWLEPALLVNLALLLVTAGVFIVYWLILVAMLRQLGEIHDQSADIRRTADATLQLATITQQSERPHLVVDIETMNWKEPPEKPDRSLLFDVKNYGKSPGRIVRYWIHAVVVRPQDNWRTRGPRPQYQDNEAEPIGFVIVRHKRPQSKLPSS